MSERADEEAFCRICEMEGMNVIFLPWMAGWMNGGRRYPRDLAWYGKVK